MLCSAWSAAASAQAEGGHGDRRASLDRASQTTVMDQHRTGITVDRGRLTFTESKWSERLRFQVDDFLSSSTYPRLSILGTSTGVLLAMATLSFWRLSGVQMEPREAAWRAWTTIADPGTHTLTPGGQGRMRSVGVIFTLGGLFFFALLIGLVNDGITTCASRYFPHSEGFCLCFRLAARAVLESITCVCRVCRLGRLAGRAHKGSSQQPRSRRRLFTQAEDSPRRVWKGRPQWPIGKFGRICWRPTCCDRPASVDLLVS